MALAHGLAETGTPAEELKTAPTVTFEPGEGDACRGTSKRTTPAAFAVTAIVIQRPEQCCGGCGEVPEPPAIAGIANAFFDATGVRVREPPLSTACVHATLAAAKAGTLPLKREALEGARAPSWLSLL